MRRFLYQGNIYPALLLKLLLALLFFSLSRSLFYVFNVQYFRELDALELLLVFLAGIRFDITAVIVLNAPFILMNVIPFPIRSSFVWQRVANIIFICVNMLGIALNTIDTVYFRFTNKRMTADIFSFIQTGEDDFISLIPRFLSDFFIEILAWILLIVVFVWLGGRIKVVREAVHKVIRYYGLNTVYFLAAAAIAIIGIRGGFQLRPITIIDAGKYTEAKYVSIVLNTPFSIIKSFGHTGLKEAEYFTDKDELNSIFSPECYPMIADSSSMCNYNVVLIIMESFGTEYIGALNTLGQQESYTPHLDSIIVDGLAFRAYANGKQSMEALPAIVASLPSLTTRPYITSAYGGNNINSIASLLGEKGYTSAFFHGGRNGTMGFESFTDIAGFENYYGKDQYGNDEHFDGSWGIYDEEFFDYFKSHLDSVQPPFMAAFFSLSSHHPYMVPEKYEGKFSKGTLDIHESIMYADYALGKFFRTARQESWYDSTLFVITADHTSLSYNPAYSSREGIYAIPLIFYMPAIISPALDEGIAQHTDIMPSILGFLGYDKGYVAFGNNLFDADGNNFAVNHLDATYQLMMGGWTMHFAGDKVLSLQPSVLPGDEESTLSPEEARDKLEAFLKAFIQQYNHRLIHNQLVIRGDE